MPGEDVRDAFLRGRLLGLKELVVVLKDSVEQGEHEALEKSLVEHISRELEEIIAELEGSVPEKEMRKVEEKHEEFKKAVAETQPLSKHVKKADELMKTLLEAQK